MNANRIPMTELGNICLRLFLTDDIENVHLKIRYLSLTKIKSDYTGLRWELSKYDSPICRLKQMREKSPPAKVKMKKEDTLSTLQANPILYDEFGC